MGLSVENCSKTDQNYLLVGLTLGLIQLLLNKPSYGSANLDLSQKYVAHAATRKEINRTERRDNRVCVPKA